MPCRAHLQARMPPGATEGILADRDGCLLEGFITNLFIISGAVLATCTNCCAPEQHLQADLCAVEVQWCHYGSSHGCMRNSVAVAVDVGTTRLLS